MKRIIALALLLSLCLLCAGCTGTAGTELAAGIGDEQLGKSYAQMEENLRTQGFTLEPMSAAGREELYDTYVLRPGKSTVDGCALSEGKNVLLRFTPAYAAEEGEQASRFAGAAFTVSAEDSAAFLKRIRWRLRDCPQVSPRETGIDGEVYLVHCYAELTAREYQATAAQTRQSRAAFATPEEPLTDTLATLDTTFAGHMETVRSSRNVAMYTITLTQNDRGEATVSVEAYGEALYRAFL